jgi:hypothetical protein
MGELQPMTGAHPSFEGRPLAGFSGVERRNWVSRDLLVRRVRSEFDEMPGLRLTFAQAKLLFGLEPGCCQRILGFLSQAGFLTRTRDGRYGRRDLVA